MQNKQLTDSEKLDILNKRMKRMEISTHIQTFIILAGFIGVVTFGELLKKTNGK
jgi:hypothetical protein